MRLEELFQSVRSVGTTNPGFAPAGMEALHGLKMFAIDVSLAELQFVCRSHGNVEVLSKDGRRQAEVTIIGQCEGLVEILKRRNGQNWSEDLLSHNVHFLPAVSEDGGLVIEAAPAVVAMAAYCNLSPIPF